MPRTVSTGGSLSNGKCPVLFVPIISRITFASYPSSSRPSVMRQRTCSVRSALVPRLRALCFPDAKYFAHCALPAPSQPCVIESPMKTTLAPPLVTATIFSLCRFICQQFGFPSHAVGVTARIAANDDMTPRDSAPARTIFFAFMAQLYHNPTTRVLCNLQNAPCKIWYNNRH